MKLISILNLILISSVLLVGSANGEIDNKIQKYLTNKVSDSEWLEFCHEFITAVATQKEMKYSELKPIDKIYRIYNINFFGFQAPIVDVTFTYYSIDYDIDRKYLSIILHGDDATVLLDRKSSALFFLSGDPLQKIFPSAITTTGMSLYMLERGNNNVVCNVNDRVEINKEIQRSLLSVKLFNPSDKIYRNKVDPLSYIQLSEFVGKITVHGVQENDGMQNNIHIQLNNSDEELANKLVTQFYSVDSEFLMPDWLIKLNEVTSVDGYSKESVEQLKVILENSGMKTKIHDDL